MSNVATIFAFGWPYLRRYWSRLAAGVLLGILFGLSNASFVWGTKTLFERLAPDQMQQEGSRAKKQNATLAAFNAAIDPWLPVKGRRIDVRQVIGGFLLLPLLVALRGFIGYLSSYCMSWVSERVIRDLRIDVLTKLNTLSMDYFNRTTIGDLLARVNGDTTALYRCLSLGFSDLIKEPITLISLLVSLFVVNPQLTLLAIIFTPLTVIPTRILGRKVRRALTSGVSVGMLQDSLLVEVYSSIRIIKAFCLEGLQMKRFRVIYDNLVRIGMKSVQARELVNPLIETISMLGLGVVIVFIFYSGVTVPKLVAFLTGVTMMYTPIKKLGALHVYFQQASVGASRLLEIFQFKPTVIEKPDAVAVPQFTREIGFENVSFAYTDKPVIKEFSLSIPRGVKLGIAGESGSGKSTLVNLLFRLYDPTKGAVKIDGVDMRDVRVYDLRQHMALVSQEVVIFDQTVAENISCGKPGSTQAEVEAAARGAFAHSFIMQLPHGYDTRLGERGVTLSGGQRQRIAIARAFVRNAPILVLDEATAALDSQAEAEVQAAIDRLSENRTVVCIAHRLSTLSKMDEIVVLTEGRIVERGTFGELLRKSGTFASMARKQSIAAA
jgi:ATP-binding cassette, subfamily B, bacterial MsbA